MPDDHAHEHPSASAAATDHAEHDHAEHGHPQRGGLLGLLSGLLGHSHDPAESADAALTADARGIRALKLSLVGLGATAAFQLAIFAISGSVALLADTIHNFSDALTALPLWFAFVIGRRLPTRSHTFGYRRAEDLAGLFVLLMIALSALLAGYESITRLIAPVAISNVAAVALAGVIGFAGNEVVALYRIRVGRQIGSAALVADGHHARADGLTSLGVLAGAAGVALGYPIADPLVGLLITLAILLVLKRAAGQMLGRLMDAVEPELVDDIERVALATPRVEGVTGLRLRWLGHTLDAGLAITVDRDLTVAGGHEIAEEVRHRLLHDLPRLGSVYIHVNPCRHAGADPHGALEHHDRQERAGAPGATADRPV